MTRRDAWWRSTATREPWRFDTPKPDEHGPRCDCRACSVRRMGDAPVGVDFPWAILICFVGLPIVLALLSWWLS